MAKFIKLMLVETDGESYTDCDPLWLNPEHIVAFFRPAGEDATTLHLVNDPVATHAGFVPTAVRETPEQILTLIARREGVLT
jgi:hypothetical protein